MENFRLLFGSLALQYRWAFFHRLRLRRWKAMFDGVRGQRKRHEEPVKILLDQSLYTAGVLAIAILLLLSLYPAILFFER
jgi:hypothetical protein